MYPKIVVSILIALAALRIIGNMTSKRKLSDASAIAMVVVLATTVIVWLIAGWSPIPEAFVRVVKNTIYSIWEQLRHISVKQKPA